MWKEKITLPEGVWKREDGRFCKKCPSCNKVQDYLRKYYAISSYNNGNLCNSCSNKIPDNNAHKGWVLGVLRVSFVNKYKINARNRGLCYDVSDLYLAQKLIDQDFKCAVSGRKISAMEVNNTASLDRINSSIGYIEGNVHWVHKMVNMCKQAYGLDEFISMCIDVSNNANS